MRKAILISILNLFINSCKGQTDTTSINNSKKDTMRYFTENKYKDWQLDKNNSSNDDKRYINKNNWARVIFTNGEYSEEVEELDSSYKYFNYYHKNNLLKLNLNFCYNFPYGISREYDEDGKLIKEINYEENYKINLEKLNTIIKQEFDIDISVRPNINNFLRYNVNRDKKEVFLNDNRYVYEVIFYVDADEGGSACKTITIDGNTGEILYQLEERMSFGGQFLPKSKTAFPQKGEKEQKQKEDNSYYKTYKGKDYTKKEWEAFEEEWYRDYKENKNKGFWDDIFPGRKKK
jgi:hypothetical protein